MDLRARLAGPRPLLLDGAMGTALLARGLDPRAEPASRWALTRPAEVRAVHAGCARAGAELLLTDTFGGGPPSPEEARAAVGLARAGLAEAGREGLVGLSLWAGLPAEAVAGLAADAAQAGADAVWLESAVSAESARAALAAALRGPLPVVATLAFTALGAPGWRELLGELGRAGAAAVGLNCSPWPHAPGALAALARELSAALPVPLVLKPDGALAPGPWAAEVSAAAAAGARLVGGCCGTSAAHLAALAARLA